VQLERNRALRDTEKNFRANMRQLSGRAEHVRQMHRCIEENHLSRCPVLEADTKDEGQVGPGVRLTIEWLTEQVKQAFANAGQRLAIDPAIIASRILKLHDWDYCVDVIEFTSDQVTPHRLFAHVHFLGIALPSSVQGTLARRMFLAIANRDAPKVVEGSADEFCEDCGAVFERGELCRCSTLKK
jgi:hypothetical protein